MNADLRHALAALEAAGVQLARVASLPAEVGARIRWSNGLVWVRVGENEWQSTGDGRPTDLEQARAGGWTAPSTHIAQSGDWILDEVPAPDLDEDHP